MGVYVCGCSAKQREFKSNSGWERKTVVEVNTQETSRHRERKIKRLKQQGGMSVR